MTVKQENASSSGRDSFNSKMGFIMACVGSAVGMGNIWLFPWRVGQFGGAAFLIPYFIFVVLIGFVGVIGEMTFGRSMGCGPLGAFKKAFDSRGIRGGTAIGLIPVIGSLGIAIGYSVVVGWILRYLWGSLTGEMVRSVNEAGAGAYFGPFASNFGSVPWHILGVAITLAIMVFGIAKGIEKVNKVLMPAFFVLFVILAIRVATMNGAAQGYSYMLRPDWTALANPKTWIYALGQAFFSLSLAGSGTVVYGSYLRKDEDIVDCAKNVAFFDTLAALVAAMVIIPAVFAYNLELGAGPGLLFVTMPTVFADMPFGSLFAVVFFTAVFFAGVTSLMNLFETPVEALQQHFNMQRKTAIAIIAVVALGVGVFLEGDALSPWMDAVSIYIIPLGATLAALTMFWVLGTPFARKEIEKGRRKPLGKWFEPATKYLLCGVAIIVLILGVVMGGIG